MRCVIIESPLHAETLGRAELHRRYADACVVDCFARGEAGFAGHVYWTRVLDDAKAAERAKGMEATFAWAREARAAHAVYVDLGVSRGMLAGVERCASEGRHYEPRHLEWSRLVDAIGESAASDARAAHDTREMLDRLSAAYERGLARYSGVRT